jgi:ABC-type amino acid transport substrate-binding protein
MPSRRAFMGLAGVVFAIAGLAAPGHAEALKLKIATEGTYKPMSYRDAAGNLTGFEVDLVRAICGKIGATCEFVTMEYDTMVPALEEGNVDAAASGMRITEKRKKVVDFADKYYTPAARFTTCRDDLDGAENSAEKLAGHSIGTQSGTSNADYLKAKYEPASPVKLYKAMDDMYLDLASKRLDYGLSNAFVGYDFLKSERGKGCKWVGEPIADPTFFGDGVGMAVKKGNDAVREKLNEGIAAVIADGTYDKLNARYWPFSVR